MSGRPAALGLYRLASALAEPLAPLALKARLRRGKEDPARLGERLGRASLPRPEGRLVWIHGASVGESLSHLPLTERWARERPDVRLLVTSGTRTAAALMAARLPPGALHQYAPIDAPGAARRFLDHWRPELGVFVESELWPNLLGAARARGVRLALLGARISEASARRWDRAPAAARAVLGLFDLIWAQDFETRDWIEAHGARVSGRFDLKRAAAPLPCDPAALERLQAAVGGRTVVAAASTHAGEEAIIAAAARALEPRPLLVVVPRHPERGPAVEAELKAAGWRTALRSRGEAPGPDVEAYVADTLGELGLIYRAADVVVMGGSFVEGLKGHNPLEPARLGRAVVSGPHVEALADAYADLAAEKAALTVRDGAELMAALGPLTAEPGLARAMGERARRACERGREGFERVWAELQELLPP
jgi:3-deoxy-D-manno-octulosonic-acid transferase